MSSAGKKQLKTVLNQLRTTTSQKNKRKIFLLDGGTGEELFRRGVPDDRKIWSATAVVHPQYHSTLLDVHESFLQAGADAITTNSYGIVPGVGFEKRTVRSQLLGTCGNIARQATERNKKKGGFIFGSLGPLVESYRPDLIMEFNDGVAEYKVACQALGSYVDAFLAETMSCVEESFQAIQAVADYGSSKDNTEQPIMLVSLTLTDAGQLRDGTEVTKGIQRILEFSKDKPIDLCLIMFNCATPESITTALKAIHKDKDLTKILRDDRKIILGAYANRLTIIDPNWTLASSEEAQPFRQDLNYEQYNQFVSEWLSLGVKIVGGCCGIKPEHISYIRKKLVE